MSQISKNQFFAAAGAAASPVWVDDLFSATVYEGNSSSRTVTSGVDLQTDGGLLWIKRRTTPIANHQLYDTATNPGNPATAITLPSDSTAVSTTTDRIAGVTNDGFSLLGNTVVNGVGSDYVAYSFKKQETFFDVVAYTGNGSNPRAIPHNLGVSPGMVIVRNTTVGVGGEWMVWHPYGQNMNLNTTDSVASAQRNNGIISSVSAASFTVTSGSTNDNYVNNLGDTYVAYIFGGLSPQNFGPNEDQSVIKIGSYSGNGSATSSPNVNVGFEPQFLLIKSTSNGSNWYLLDVARQNMGYKNGWTYSNDYYLAANDANYESSPINAVFAHPTGFRPLDTGTVNSSGVSFMYMAIRRRMEPPKSSNGYFNVTSGNTSSIPNYSMPVRAPDLALRREDITSGSGATSYTELGTRGHWSHLLYTGGANSAGANFFKAEALFDYQNGWWNGTTSTSSYSWMWARAPEFCEVVFYPGNGTSQNINHGLTVPPEMMWVKKVNGTASWAVYHTSTGPTKGSFLNLTGPVTTSSGFWNDTAPSSTQFTVGSSGDTNGASDFYAAFLFCTKAGVSKVGQYTGTGADLNVDCGFGNSSRFVMIKRLDATNQAWWMFDSERGITASASPYLQPGESTAENGGGAAPNWITPYSGGFGVKAGAANFNTLGVVYSFYAVAQ